MPGLNIDVKARAIYVISHTHGGAGGDGRKTGQIGRRQGRRRREGGEGRRSKGGEVQNILPVLRTEKGLDR